WHRDDVAALARGIAARIDLARVDLVLTGGETARRVLDEAGIAAITPQRELAPGVVLSGAPSGGSVVTRPGSFGGPDSLVDIITALRPGFGRAGWPRGPRTDPRTDPRTERTP
ncbi:MAG: 4-hydroxythreonine-4-phosphate dehydrogenase, partial [Microbacteriaceae bacterium]|nr:4-hydroxythreonine-4-phosphate dehydrogenase [Microbacteriaceae bacterium]